MLIIKKKKDESIERMLRRYKRKHKDAKIKDESIKRKHFVKPSEKRRGEILKARYKNKKFQEYEV